MKRIPTTVDRKVWKKWLLCPALALLLVLTSLPVYAGEQKTEVTETPTVTQETGSESAVESAASSEQDELMVEEIEPIDLQEVTTTVNSDWRTFQPHEGVVLHGGYVGFKNKGTGKYLTVPNGVTDQNTNVCMQSASLVVNAQEFYLEYIYDEAANQAFFRIYSVTSTGASSNIVRSASNSMYTANVKLFSKNVLNATERWQIEHVEGNYYCIYLASNPDSTGTRYALTATPGEGSASENTLMSSGNAVVDVYTGADNQLWEICADGKPMDINGYDISQGGSHEAILGTTVSYYYVPKAFNISLYWSATPANYITSYGNGKIKTKKCGKVNVQLQYVLSGGVLPLTKSSSLFCMPQEGMYFLSNAGSDKYMDIEGPSTQTGAVIQQWQFSLSNTRKWYFINDENSTGYFYIKSAYSEKYLSVDAINNTIVEQTATLNDYALWRLEYTARGNFILMCKGVQNDNMVLSVPQNGNGNGVDLTMLAYNSVSTPYNEWKIHLGKDASLIALPEEYDRSSYFRKIETLIDDIGYIDNYNNHSTIEQGITTAELLERIRFSRITLVRTHGSPTVVETSNGYLEVTDMQALSSNALMYSELVIYGACLTAQGGLNADNLVVATANAGARTVIGFENSVSSYACNLWCRKFFEYYAQYYDDTEKSWLDVCISADEYVKENYRYYEYISDEGNLVSTKNYLIAGQISFPE